MLDKPIQPLFKQHLDSEPGELQLLKTLNMPPTSRARRSFTTVRLHSSSSPTSQRDPEQLFFQLFTPWDYRHLCASCKARFWSSSQTNLHPYMPCKPLFLPAACTVIYSEGTGRLKQEMVFSTKMILPSVWSFFRHTSCPL